MRPRHRPTCCETRATRDPGAGFTLVEALVVLALIGLLASLSFSAIESFLRRKYLEDAVGRVSSLLRTARMEAIKRRVTTVVQVSFVNDEIVAFADVHDSSFAACVEDSNLLLDPPCGPSLPEFQTDHVIARVALSADRASGAVLWSPEDAQPEQGGALTGLTSRSTVVPDFESQVLVFEADGTVRDTGAIRIADATGRNFLEIAITTQAGLVELRKWLLRDDVPLPFPAPAFYGRTVVQTGAGGEVPWAWY